MAFDIPVTIADATLTISKEDNYLVNVTVDQNGVITSQLFYGNILILINGKPVYIVLEAGDYLAVVYSQNNEQCFNECFSGCPKNTPDGYVEYLDLTKTEYGGFVENNLIYASSYCFFESLNEKGDALKKYQNKVVEYRNNNEFICIGDFLKEVMGEESTLMINKFKIGKLCGVPFGSGGDKWHKFN